MDTDKPPPGKLLAHERLQRHRFWGPLTWAIAGPIAGVAGVAALVATVLAGSAGGAASPTGGQSATALPNASATPAPSATAATDEFFAGWSPARHTYSVDDPPAKPVLNSTIDNPEVGEETSFTSIRLFDPTDSAPWQYEVDVELDETVQVRMSVNNDARAELGPAGTIHNLQAGITFERSPTQTLMRGWLQGDNADVVMCDVVINHPKNVTIQYARDTGVFRNASGDHDLPNDFGDGEWVQLGSDTLDGEFASGDDGAGFVFFTLWATR